MSITLDDVLAALMRVLEFPLVTFGSAEITPLGIFKFFALVALVFVFEYILRRYFVLRLLRRTHLDSSLQYAVSKMAGYMVIALGLYVAFKVVGLDLSSLAVVAGAIGLGLGFGLQTIISNFVSGLIILAERPISIGDRIEVGDVAGQVRQINLRATTVVTNDNISIIVPNSHFISETVTNWSHGDPKVAYGSDTELVRRVLLEVAQANEMVLKEPAPTVFFDGFGDSSLNFELGVWTSEMMASPRRFRSDLNFAIDRVFREHGIEIPFPQRDLHLRSGSLTVRPAKDGGQDIEVRRS
jgi:small-conductance mechanosensitive channel